MSHSLDLEKLCHECVSIARDAGKAILTIYDAGFDIDEKHDKRKMFESKECLYEGLYEGLFLQQTSQKQVKGQIWSCWHKTLWACMPSFALPKMKHQTACHINLLLSHTF